MIEAKRSEVRDQVVPRIGRPVAEDVLVIATREAIRAAAPTSSSSIVPIIGPDTQRLRIIVLFSL